MKLRCIFVGVHNRGLQMLELFTHDSRFLPVALVDVSVDVCREITAVNGWGDLPGFDSLAPAVAQVEADAVVISTPSAFHGAYTRQALEAGLHVYVATPFTTDLEDAIALVELAADRRLAIVVDQQQKYGVTERTLTGWTREKRKPACVPQRCAVCRPPRTSCSMWTVGRLRQRLRTSAVPARPVTGSISRLRLGRG